MLCLPEPFYNQARYTFPHDTGLFLLRTPASCAQTGSLDSAALALGVHRLSFVLSGPASSFPLL
jgi:hypothetical protein